MGERPHQHHFQRDVDRGGEQRGLDRGQRVAAGIERRGEAPHHDEGQEPDGVGGERGAGGGGIGRGEGAAGKQRAHDEIGNGDGAGDARNGHQQRQLDAARLRESRAALVAGGEPPRHLRQQHGADGNADHADGKLVDAVGVIERRQRAGRQEGGDQRVGEERKLHAAGADDGRPERLQEAPRGRVELRHAEPDADAAHLGVDARPAATCATPAMSTPQAAA